METKEIIKKILDSKERFWIVEKSLRSNPFLQSDIILISLPIKIWQKLKKEKIDILEEEFKKMEIDWNISLIDCCYQNFQANFTFKKVIQIHPIKGDIKMYLKQAQKLKSNIFKDYIDLSIQLRESNFEKDIKGNLVFKVRKLIGV